MANYYRKFSATFAVPPGAVAFAKAVQASNSGFDLAEYVEDTDFTVEEIEALASEAQDWFPNYSLALKGEDDDALLSIRDDNGDGDPTYAAWFLQRIQQRFDIDETWSFEYANTADKPVSDGFGGGVVAVHRTGYEVEDSSERRADLEKRVTPAPAAGDLAP